MICFFRFCVQPRHWELEHSASDSYGIYVLFRFCVQPRHWELEHSESDCYDKYVCSASAFNQDIGSWNTAQVTTMYYVSFRFCVQPRHWELEHSESDYYVCMFYPLLRSTTTFPRGLEPRRRQRKRTCFRRNCVSSEIHVHQRRPGPVSSCVPK